MKKLFLSLVAAIVAATATYAQNSLIAVLTHERTVQTFYGAGALSEAHAAAVNGDVITLSSGTFTAIDITKSITIRGAGMEMDEENKLAPTVITGSFKIGGSNISTVSNFLLEGVYCDNAITCYKLNNPTFIKCKIKSIGLRYSSYNNNYTWVYSATLLHCKLLDYYESEQKCTSTLISCLVNSPRCHNSSNSPIEFINCIIRYNNTGSYYTPSQLYFSSLTNCIITTSPSNNNIIPATASVYYCVGEKTANGTNIFQNLTNSTNYTIEKGQFDGLFKPDTFYELTDEAKEAYKGQDDTEVGIYGGNMPYDPFTTNPKITKYIVAGKSTADGKLSVDIEVKAAE